MLPSSVAASPAQFPAQRCKGGKFDAAGRSFACLTKARKGFVLQGDATRLAAAYARCSTKLAVLIPKLETTANGACPTAAGASDQEAALAGSASRIADVLVNASWTMAPVR